MDKKTQKNQVNFDPIPTKTISPMLSRAGSMLMPKSLPDLGDTSPTPLVDNLDGVMQWGSPKKGLELKRDEEEEEESKKNVIPNRNEEINKIFKREKKKLVLKQVTKSDKFDQKLQIFKGLTTFIESKNILQKMNIMNNVKPIHQRINSDIPNFDHLASGADTEHNAESFRKKIHKARSFIAEKFPDWKGKTVSNDVKSIYDGVSNQLTNINRTNMIHDEDNDSEMFFLKLEHDLARNKYLKYEVPQYGKADLLEKMARYQQLLTDNTPKGAQEVMPGNYDKMYRERTEKVISILKKTSKKLMNAHHSEDMRNPVKQLELFQKNIEMKRTDKKLPTMLWQSPVFKNDPPSFIASSIFTPSPVPMISGIQNISHTPSSSFAKSNKGISHKRSQPFFTNSAVLKTESSKLCPTLTNESNMSSMYLTQIDPPERFQQIATPRQQIATPRKKRVSLFAQQFKDVTQRSKYILNSSRLPEPELEQNKIQNKMHKGFMNGLLKTIDGEIEYFGEEKKNFTKKIDRIGTLYGRELESLNPPGKMQSIALDIDTLTNFASFGNIGKISAKKKLGVFMST